MEKKYKIKDKYSHLFKQSNLELEMPLERWVNVTMEALEEVPQRICLFRASSPTSVSHYDRIMKLDHSTFTESELLLCKKALNGELLDINSFDDYDFNKWYEDADVSLSLNDREFFKTVGIRESLKEYLKQTK